MINDHAPRSFISNLRFEKRGGKKTHMWGWGQPQGPKLDLERQANGKHLQAVGGWGGGVIKGGREVADGADKGAGVGRERPELRANEEDG